MLNSVELRECIVSAEAVLARLLDPKVSPVATELLEKKKTGGYLVVATRAAEPLLITRIGQIEPAVSHTCFQFAQEKVVRLAAYDEHYRSFESRAPVEKRYGGAIRDLDHIVSFSGLPEGLDEILSMIVLLAHSGFSLPFYLDKMTDNPYVEKLGLEYLQDTVMAAIKATAKR